MTPEASLAVARAVSAAVVDVVRAARAARPAWVVAKGGITSHDVAVRALGIRRANQAVDSVGRGGLAQVRQLPRLGADAAATLAIRA